MDEATRFQSAFAMAQTMGVTAPKLIETTQHYLNVLANEERKFQQAVANQENGAINAKEQEIAHLEQTINSKKEQIKKLTEEIEAVGQKVGELKSEITESATKVQETKNNFAASYHLLVKQVESDFQKMKQYLK